MDIHSFCNRYHKDSTYKKGSKSIDLVATTSRLLEYIDRYRLIDYNEIIVSNYQGYLIDINLENYFDIKQFSIDYHDYNFLNSC